MLPFQNEYLLANLQNPDGTEETLAMVPDLISLVGTDGFALGTQDIKYGMYNTQASIQRDQDLLVK